MIADPRIAGVSLTGSERAGAAVAEIAGRNLKKVVLELGGSDPFVLLSTDDLEAVVSAAVAARMDNAGQVCNAPKRFIVAEELYEPFLDQFTTSMLAAADGGAPMSSLRGRRRAARTGRPRRGARRHPAHRRGALGGVLPPAVLTGVVPDQDVFAQELFGPVAMVFRVSSEAEAVALANDTPYGLGAYVFTTDPEQAERVANQIDAGMVFVNGVCSTRQSFPSVA